MSKPRTRDRDLAHWTRVLAEQRTAKPSPGSGSGSESLSGQTVKVRLGAWVVNLIGIADDGEPETGASDLDPRPGLVVEVDCPVELLALHGELVKLFGDVQKKFVELIDTQVGKEKNENAN